MLAVLVPAIVLWFPLTGPGQAHATTAAGADHGSRSPDSGAARHHDVSPALGGLAPVAAPPRGEHADQPLPIPAASTVGDPVVQAASSTSAAPSAGTGFTGLGVGFVGPQGAFSVANAPPDPAGAVGPNHYVQIVNASMAVFDKGGRVLRGPITTATLWAGFGGACETTNDGDAIVRYDNLADRWFITQFANVASTSGPYLQCVAVSTSADPLGTYARYSFWYTNFADYAKVGLWPDAYYVTFNMFTARGGSVVGSQACAYDRTAMLAAAPASQQCFTTTTAYGGLLPADLDGPTPPPAGQPNTLIALGSLSTTLASWRFHVDWTNPTNSSFTGPTEFSVAPYTQACSGGTCVPQPGTTNQLDTLADRLMQRLAYRNFGDHQSLVVCDTVSVGGTPAVRWYELRLSGPTASVDPAVYQQGTFSPDATARWMGSIAMDRLGGIAVGYSASSTTVYPSIRYTGRLATDPLGQMSQGESTMVAGAGSQTGTLTRWGDYSTMAVDPSDGCVFWYTNEYIPSSGTFNWATKVGSFHLPGCTPRFGQSPGFFQPRGINAVRSIGVDSAFYVFAKLGALYGQTSIFGCSLGSDNRTCLGTADQSTTDTIDDYSRNEYVNGTAVTQDSAISKLCATTPGADFVRLSRPLTSTDLSGPCTSSTLLSYNFADDSVVPVTFPSISTSLINGATACTGTTTTNPPTPTPSGCQLGPVSAGWRPGDPLGGPYSGTAFTNLTTAGGATSLVQRIYCPTNASPITDWGQLTDKSHTDGSGANIGALIYIPAVDPAAGSSVSWKAVVGCDPNGRATDGQMLAADDAPQVADVAQLDHPGDTIGQANQPASSLYFLSYGVSQWRPYTEGVTFAGRTTSSRILNVDNVAPSTACSLPGSGACFDNNGVAVNQIASARKLYAVVRADTLRASTAGLLDWICDTDPSRVNHGVDMTTARNYADEVDYTINTEFLFTRVPCLGSTAAPVVPFVAEGSPPPPGGAAITDMSS